MQKVNSPEICENKIASHNHNAMREANAAKAISNKDIRLKNTFMVRFYKRAIGATTRLLYRIRVTGVDNIPDKGGALLVCNHVSYVDGLIIHSAIKRPVIYIIYEGIYYAKGVHYFLSRNGAIPIAPNREKVKEAIRQAKQYLEEGYLVCIFPEGMLTKTGHMNRFKFGVEWILKECSVPVIPMGLRGLWGSVLSRKYNKNKGLMKFMPRSFRRVIHLNIGKPIVGDIAKINLLQKHVMLLKDKED